MNNDKLQFLAFTPAIGKALKGIVEHPPITDIVPRGSAIIGKQQIIPRPAISSQNENYSGLFAVSYDAQTKKIVIGEGFLSCNGSWFYVPTSELDPQTGMVCVHSQIGEDGYWSTPIFKIGQPDKYHYPIGRCEVNEQRVSVKSFCVSVAMIIDAAVCPIIVEANEES